MDMKRGLRRGLIAGITAIGVLVVAPVLVPIVRPCDINSVQWRLNVNTGVVQRARYVWFFRVSREVLATSVSGALAGEVVRNGRISGWKPMSAYSPGSWISTDYEFHHALGQMGYLNTFFLASGMSNQEKKAVAIRVVTMWQEGQLGEAGLYIDGLLREQLLQRTAPMR
jgi:hypothetical protein